MQRSEIASENAASALLISGFLSPLQTTPAIQDEEEDYVEVHKGSKKERNVEVVDKGDKVEEDNEEIDKTKKQGEKRWRPKCEDPCLVIQPNSVVAHDPILGASLLARLIDILPLKKIRQISEPIFAEKHLCDQLAHARESNEDDKSTILCKCHVASQLPSIKDFYWSMPIF